MNDYLVTYDGGQDVYADDLSFMQNSLKSMIDTAVRTYGDNCILWGCLDSGKTNVVEGGVVISGKLYHVPALGAIGSNKLCFREVLSDERTFENQQVHKVKKQYEAYLSTDTSGAVAWIDLANARMANLNKALISHVRSSGSANSVTFDSLKKIDGAAQYITFNHSILIRSDGSIHGTYCSISASFTYGARDEKLTLGVCSNDNSIVALKIGYDGNNTFNMELVDSSKQIRGGGIATLFELIN